MKSKNERVEEPKLFPHPVDKYVGGRLRTLRVLRGFTQSKVGNSLGLTFQQIQKYERGLNRIGSSRLYEISNILKVPISYFFDGVELVFKAKNTKNSPENTGLDLQEDEQEPYKFSNPIYKRETLELIRSYYGIKNAEVRKGVFTLCKSLSSDASGKKRSGKDKENFATGD